MKYQIKTSIQINATPEKVWDVFTDFNSYSEWNPFIKSIKGDVLVGNQIAAEIDTMKFKPTILKCKENEELTWMGSLFFKGLFDGRHSFQLIISDDGKTTFIHQEHFSGILVRLMKNKLENEFVDKFEAMNKELKERVENSL